MKQSMWEELIPMEKKIDSLHDSACNNLQLHIGCARLWRSLTYEFTYHDDTQLLL